MIVTNNQEETETTCLLGNAIHDDRTDCAKTKQGQQSSQQQLFSHHSWVPKALTYIALLATGFVAGTFLQSSIVLPNKWKNVRKRHARSTCLFCDQSPPELHHDKSYTVQIPNNSEEHDEPIVVTPMTISYEYELYDGQNIFTLARNEFIPNLDFDYAVLGLSSARNLNRDTGEAVSLDEVYLHHFTLQPINMIGAEVLNRDDERTHDPYFRFPEGYALHVMADEQPYLRVNAHLLSNKNLAPINGSLGLAHKECNECYYSPGKGSDCTPDVSGTFLCCGDSPACTVGGEVCACATTTVHSSTRSQRITTKYRIELDLLVSTDVHKFKRVDQWNFAAPACSINAKGEGVFEDYPADNYCGSHDDLTTKPKTLNFGRVSLFHQVPENNEEPYLQTAVSIQAPSGGKMVWAQSHLHTGGVNATLYKNGQIICTTDTEYGTNPDAFTNSRDEQNHLVRISSCYDQIRDGIFFQTGDIFTTESYYYAGKDDRRFSERLVAGEHKNVMSMFFTGVVFDGNSKFFTEERTSFNLFNDFVLSAGLSNHPKK